MHSIVEFPFIKTDSLASANEVQKGTWSHKPVGNVWLFFKVLQSNVLSLLGIRFPKGDLNVEDYRLPKDYGTHVDHLERSYISAECFWLLKTSIFLLNDQDIKAI